MLRPQDTPTRERKQVTGLWQFRFDPEDRGVREGWYRGTFPADSYRVPTCASFNDLFTRRELSDYVGAFWYQIEVKLPICPPESRIGLYFESVTHRARVWVDEAEAAFHEGGYLPFEADVGGRERSGQQVRITVRVENQLSFQTLPPGMLVERAGGKRLTYWHDFFNYAGIHRPVWLFVRPKVCIQDLTVTTAIDGADGVIRYRAQTETRGEHLSVEVNVYDREGRPVAHGQGWEGEVSVPQAHLWAPGDGYLYRTEFLLYENGQLRDSYCLRTGIRTVQIDGTRFLVNGQPFYFQGFGMHEDAAILGKGHNDALMVHDFALLEWIGANSLRTSHYPYSEDVMDYADERGILVIDETPAVGLNMNISSGIFSGKTLRTFTEDTVNECTRRNHAAAIRELIDRDKNHPCVVIWSIANEPESQTEAAAEYFGPLFELTRSIDPTRPVGFVNMALATHGLCRVSRFADVIMLNRYYGWYSDTADLPSAEITLRQELEGWAQEGKPIIMTEYGADTLPGLHAVIAQPWTEEYQVELLEMYHRVFDSIDAVTGEQVWNFADFATAPGVMRVDGNRKGVFTRERNPKSAAFALRKRWRKKSRTGSGDLAIHGEKGSGRDVVL